MQEVVRRERLTEARLSEEEAFFFGVAFAEGLLWRVGFMPNARPRRCRQKIE